MSLIYSFINASGGGFTRKFEKDRIDEIAVNIGAWSAETEQENLENWKEFGNLIERVESKAEKGELKGAIVFLFTDSSTVEDCVDKENSKSKELF